MKLTYGPVAVNRIDVAPTISSGMVRHIIVSLQKSEDELGDGPADRSQNGTL